jgi:hypothetical protein
MPKYLIPFTMDGEVELEAETREEAARIVDAMSAKDLTEHLDDTQTFPPETLEERAASEAEWKAQLEAHVA